ncbi:hypothetical protein [Streptosporangium sp. NPDC006930]|uniref:hypothetical protein n=1 Tax=Streptosporangium sp. NPDC006930 TaxID=3154783 RepID=UPI0034374681
MFKQPSAGSDFKAADHIGHLIIFYVRELREGIVTSFGTSDAISVDLVVLTDPKGPRPETQVLLFQKPLIGSLRTSIGGEPVLARLGQGTAKPGQSAPYILQPFNEQDAAFATQYLNSVGGNPFQSTPTFAAPAPAPVAQAPVAPLPQAVPPQAAYPAPSPAPAAYPAPQAAPIPVPAPAGNQQAEAMAAMQALGMTVPPPAPVPAAPHA